MGYTLSPIGGAGAQFFDNSGVILSGGKLYTYLAGTTTPIATVTSPAGTTNNTNPIILDAAGRPPQEIWLSMTYAYKFILKDANDVQIASYDNIPGLPQPPLVNDASSVSYEQGFSVTAGAFVVGKTYLITSVGTTNFQTIGASTNAPGIYFTATGAGTGTGTALLVRTVQNKLQESVSVKDFGAVGNGTTDDTAAIQAAINSGAKRIYLPAGTYRTTATINVISRDLVIYGDGVSGTIILPDLSVLIGIQIGGDTISDTSYFVLLQDLTVSRATGTPPTNSIGISWWNYNYGTEINVRSTRHYYCRKITSAIFPTTGFITIGYKAFTTYADNATRAYTCIENTAEAHFDMIEMGLNGGESYAPLYCIEIKGEANDVIVANSNLIPRGPNSSTTTSMVGFIDFVNTSGLFNFNNCNIENALHGFVSNSGTALVNELAVLGGRYAVTGDAVIFDAATEVRASQFTAMKCATAFKLTKPIWTTVNGCLFNSVVLVGGTGANLTFNDNTVLGATTISGAWDQLTLIANQFNFTPTFTATGTYTQIDNLTFDWRSGEVEIDANGNVALTDGSLNIGTTTPNTDVRTQLYITHPGNAAPGVVVKNTNPTPTLDTVQLLQNAAASSSWTFAGFYSDVLLGAARQFAFYGNGNGKCNGAWTGGGADYAEYFEWADGNPLNDDRRGYTVAFVGDKIKIAEVGDVVVGVVSATPSVVGNAAWNTWQGKFLMDDFGVAIKDVDGRPMLNPAFDENEVYVPREDRKEWSPIGLVGKLRVRKDQVTNPNWVKLRSVSNAIDEWLVK
jgi:hypothetical protein